MDIYTLALSIAYTNKTIKAAELEGFKVQVETTRDILETVGEEKTFYFLPKVVSEPQNGYDEYIYVNDSWELMGSTDIDLSGYMTLALLNPTAEEIAAMSAGQLYGDKIKQDEYEEALTVKLPQGFSYQGVLKFFSALASDSRYPRIYRSQMRPLVENVDFHPKVGSFWIYYTTDDSVQSLYVLSYNGGSGSSQYWRKLNNHIDVVNTLPVSDPMPRKINYSYNISGYEIPPYDVNDEIIVSANGQVTLYKCLGYTKVYDSALGGYKAVYNWQEKSRVYSKTEIDSMIGDIETLLSEV